MKTNREDLLKQLESVTPGLSTKEIIEQSSCFIFKGDAVHTYNDEIACSQKCCLELEAAVPAPPFLAILRKLPDDNLTVTREEGSLIIKGKQRRTSLRVEEEILLPVDSIKKPKEWKPLPDGFVDAVNLVEKYAGKDESQFVTTCVHLHPKYIQATDRFQAARFKIKTPIEDAFLVRQSSIKHITSLDMTEFGETENWVHFRSPTGLVLSCRRFIEEFPSIGKLFKVEGNEITLPKGLVDAADRADVFSSENIEDNYVTILIKPNKIKIIGKGVLGKHDEVKKTQYEGPHKKFTIPPSLLIQLIRQHNVCEITEDKLIMKFDRFTYVTVLGAVEDKKEE